MDLMYTNFKALPVDHLATDSRSTSIPPVEFTSSPALIGGNVLLTLEQDKIAVEAFGPIGDNTQKLISVVSGAEILQRLRHTESGRDVRYFMKPNDAEEDLDTLDLIPEVASLNMFLEDGTMVIAGRSSPQANITIITLLTEHITWKIMYGVTLEAARTMVLSQAKEIAIAQAWRNERMKIVNSRRGTINWTASERDNIFENGFLTGYEGHYALDPEVFPEVAFDGNAITLLRVPESLQSPV